VLTTDGFTLSETHVEVGDGHRLYVQDWGKADAPPVLFVHGGPGMGTTDDYKQYFDPSRQRVLFCDQRGVGRSEPYGSLRDNTTDHLVGDIVRVLDHFGWTRPSSWAGRGARAWPWCSPWRTRSGCGRWLSTAC
jgi:proline iminopeptidase